MVNSIEYWQARCQKSESTLGLLFAVNWENSPGVYARWQADLECLVKEFSTIEKTDMVINREHLRLFLIKLKGYLAQEYKSHWRPHSVAKDIVYLLGTSIQSERYECARGADRFIRELIPMLEN